MLYNTTTSPSMAIVKCAQNRAVTAPTSPRTKLVLPSKVKVAKVVTSREKIEVVTTKGDTKVVTAREEPKVITSRLESSVATSTVESKVVTVRVEPKVKVVASRVESTVDPTSRARWSTLVTCSQCSRTFSNVSDLTAHLEMHNKTMGTIEDGSGDAMERNKVTELNTSDVKSSVAKIKSSKTQVMLPLMKLPINVKRRRTASQEGRDDERVRGGGGGGGPVKKIKIQDGGQELTVNCEVDRPRCRVCKLTYKNPAALRYHNVMTHSEVEVTGGTSPTPTTPGPPLTGELKGVSTSPRSPRHRVRVKSLPKPVEMVHDIVKPESPQRNLEESSPYKRLQNLPWLELSVRQSPLKSSEMESVSIPPIKSPELTRVNGIIENSKDIVSLTPNKLNISNSKSEGVDSDSDFEVIFDKEADKSVDKSSQDDRKSSRTDLVSENSKKSVGKSPIKAKKNNGKSVLNYQKESVNSCDKISPQSSSSKRIDFDTKLQELSQVIATANGSSTNTKLNGISKHIDTSKVIKKNEEDHLNVDATATESKANNSTGKKVLKSKTSVKVATSNVKLDGVGKNTTPSNKMETSISTFKSKENSSATKKTESSSSPAKSNKADQPLKKSVSVPSTVTFNNKISPTIELDSIDSTAKKSKNKSPKKQTKTSTITANDIKNSSPSIKEGASNPTAIDKVNSSFAQNDENLDFITESNGSKVSEADASKAIPSPKTKRKPRRSRGSRVSLISEEPETIIPKRRKSERTYEGDKLFGCNHCPLAFSSKEARMEHERTHQEKPHECPYCEMRFLAVISMNRHMRIHK